MKGKKLLAAFLLGVGLCFVPALGHGEIKGIEIFNTMSESKVSSVELFLLGQRVAYIMRNPTSFLDILFLYHKPRLENVKLVMDLPESVDTAGKLIIWIKDNRGVFSDKSETALLYLFEVHLKSIWFWISGLVPDMDNDVVAIFYSKERSWDNEGTLEGILGYFYQGEYHLWER